MEKKEFSKFKIAAIKRTAQNISSFITKRNKLVAKKEALDAEINSINEAIDKWEAPIMEITGGKKVEELVDRVQVKTGTDKEGKPIMGYRFVMKECVAEETETSEAEETVDEQVDSSLPDDDLFPQRESSDDALNF